ncbi:Spo0B domain-containing protein [Sporosarcina sp. G11-34]|uniref:Spo0B domain-containing protein n=1 Tax=Sporosarcina sp. G11-34 TaxID=2849605 RepID=UPI0022A9971D|nr:Spo0B domain-containing protein [Sporosarcina sp. G11-34]MCZ2258403.1 Spo0B domain-containing protein [Sporosarcina sp. G11-34]
MGKSRLTTLDALKFSRHDFLNELQLVLMYIDLGEPLKAKKAILNATNDIRQVSMLGKLGLPETEQWISTFSWMYTAFQTKLSCTIESGVRKVDDLAVASYLAYVFSDIQELLDASFEYEASIEVRATSTDWLIDITIQGPLIEKQQLPKVEKGFHVEETILKNLWKLTISGN